MAGTPTIFDGPRWRRLIAHGAAVLVALAALTLGWQIFSRRDGVNRLNLVEQRQTAIARNADAILHDVIDAELATRSSLASGGAPSVEYRQDRAAALRAETALRDLVKAGDALAPAVARVSADRARAFAAMEDTLDLARANRARAAARAASGAAALLSLRSSSRALSDAAQDRAAEAGAEARRLRDRAGPVMFAFSALFAASFLTAVFVVWRERRALRRLARDLDAARIRAETADAAKTRFLALASHDMRQPLHAMTLYLAALRRRVDGEQARQIVGNMELAAQSLTRMFSGLLDLARIESGVLIAKPRPMALQRVFDAVAKELRDDAARAKVDLRVVASSLHVHSDPELLESIIRNLVTNAIKYAPGGRILLGARRAGGTARLMVIDEGPGIPEDKLVFVFGEFVRLDAVKNKSVDGLGLGLSIAARLAKLLGETLDVQSAPGRGSTFSITAPIVGSALSEEVDGEDAERRDLTGLHLAVMDDDPMARAAMQGVLADAGARVSAFATAETYVGAHLRGDRHDLVIVDPAMLGEASRLVAKLPDYKSPRLLVVTGATDAPTLARLEASRLPWLIKPIKEALLLQTVLRSVRRRAREPLVSG